MPKPSYQTELSEDQCRRMEAVQEHAARIGTLISDERNGGEADPRWANIAATHFEQGFMALKRAIAKPGLFG